MNPLLLGPLLELGKSIIDRFLPDPAAKAAAELELLKMTMDGELKQVISQLEINAKEASHQSIFVAGWRPWFGWVAGMGFAYAIFGLPFWVWYCDLYALPSPPELNIDLLWVVASGMLGIGGLRTVEKIKGIVKK